MPNTPLDVQRFFPDMEHIGPGRDLFAQHPIRYDTDYGDDAGLDQLEAIRDRLRRLSEQEQQHGTK